MNRPLRKSRLTRIWILQDGTRSAEPPSERPALIYELFQTRHKGRQKWSWRALAINGEPQAGPMEPFPTRAHALRAVRRLIHNSLNAAIVMPANV